MADPRKSAEALRNIQDLQRRIGNHQSAITRLEREKSDKIRYLDQQIQRERDEIKRHSKRIDELKRDL